METGIGAGFILSVPWSRSHTWQHQSVTRHRESKQCWQVIRGHPTQTILVQIGKLKMRGQVTWFRSPSSLEVKLGQELHVFPNITSERIINLKSKDFAALESMTSARVQVAFKLYQVKSAGQAFQCLFKIFCTFDLKLLHQNLSWLPSGGYLLIRQPPLESEAHIGQCFLNGVCNPVPRGACRTSGSDSDIWGWCLRFCISNKPRVLQMLLAHGPPFKVQGQRECRDQLPHRPLGYDLNDVYQHRRNELRYASTPHQNQRLPIFDISRDEVLTARLSQFCPA